MVKYLHYLIWALETKILKHVLLWIFLGFQVFFKSFRGFRRGPFVMSWTLYFPWKSKTEQNMICRSLQSSCLIRCLNFTQKYKCKKDLKADLAYLKTKGDSWLHQKTWVAKSFRVNWTHFNVLQVDCQLILWH